MPCAPADSCVCKNSAPSRPDSQASSTATYGAVALPGRAESERQPLLWTTAPAKPGCCGGSSGKCAPGNAGAPDTAIDMRSASSISTCVRTSPTPNGRCCRELKGEQEQRALIDPDTIRDFIIGLSDGLTVPFALTAGLSSVGSSKLVVIAGVAELTSGAISMAIGGYLSAQAEKEHYDHSEVNTAGRVAQSCDEQIQSEVLDILAPYGIVGPVASQVAEQLQQAETAKQQRLVQAASKHEREELAARGITPFLLRLGQGLEPVSSERSTRSALNIGVAYLVGGLVPLTPYFFFATAIQGLIASTIITGITLLLFGVAKHRVTGGDASAKSYAWSALSTLAVGGAAAASSWFIVKMLEGPDSHL